MPERRKVEIVVEYLKIGEVSTIKEQFDAEVLVTSKWREPLLDKREEKTSTSIPFRKFWNPKLFIENALGNISETRCHFLVKDEEDEAYIVEKLKIKGSFLETFELWYFPFDVQDLQIAVTSNHRARDTYLVDDLKDIHKINTHSFKNEHEWYLYKCVERVHLDGKRREDTALARPSLVVKCRVARYPTYFFWNMFFFTFLITLLSLLTFAISSDIPQNRLQLAFTLILTAVAFKFSVNQSMPRHSYLSYLDEFILVSTMMLTLICFWHGAQTLLPDGLDRLDDRLAVAVSCFLYTVYIIFFSVRVLIKEMLRKYVEKRRRERIDSIAVRHHPDFPEAMDV